MDPTHALAAPLVELGEQARDYVAQAVAANTRRAYAADWRLFVAWCEAHQLAPLPAAPETVALYLVAHADVRKAATLGRPMDRHGQVADAALAAQSVALVVKRAAEAAGLDARR